MSAIVDGEILSRERSDEAGATRERGRRPSSLRYASDPSGLQPAERPRGYGHGRLSALFGSCPVLADLTRFDIHIRAVLGRLM